MECEACDGDGSLMYYLAKKRCVELGGRRIDLPDGSWTYEVGGKEIELKGKVQDLTQRRRAVELAETTAGVEKVTDLLQTEAP